MFDLHVSDLNAFRECRRKWYLGSKTQQNMEPDRPQKALWFGTAVHFGLEMYNGSLARGATRETALENMLQAYSDWMDASITEIKEQNFGLMPEQEKEFEDTIALGHGMLLHYSDWVEPLDAEQGIEYLDTEVEFSYPLNEEFTAAGRFDGLAKAHGKLWVIENKTAASLTTEHLLLDDQAGAYILAARLLYGEDVAGIMYNFLRKKLPVVPERLRSGELSRRANMDTTYEVYLGEILDAGENPKNYEDMLIRLKAKGNTFFKREFVTRSTYETHALRKRFIDIAGEIKRAVENGLLYPSPGKFTCQRCSFIPVCLAMAEGADWKFILDTNYRKRPEHDRVRIEWGDFE